MRDVLAKHGVTTAAVLEVACGVSLADGTAYENGLAALRAGNYQQAADQFEEVVKVHPDWAPGLKTLGQCYYLLGRPAHPGARVRRLRAMVHDCAQPWPRLREVEAL